MAQPNLLDVFRPQSLHSYIASYNNIARQHLASEAVTFVNKTTATKGAITNPEKRLTPKRIEPWLDSDVAQERGIINTILRNHAHAGAGAGSETVCDDDALFLFPCKQHVDHVAEELVRLDAENALLLYDADTLHKPATRILRALLSSDRARTAIAQHLDAVAAQQRQFQNPNCALSPGEVSFPTHLNSLGLGAGSKRKRDHNRALPTTRSLTGPADVFCIFEPRRAPDAITVGSSAKLLFLKEAKASHKLTTDIIDRAVGVGGGSLEPEVIMGRGQGTEDDLFGRPDTNACEYWFSAVCAQIYSSMIKRRMRYGIISTGACYLFMAICPDDPSTLRYSICRPSADIATSPLVRVVALALLAMRLGILPATPQLEDIQNGNGLIWATRANTSFTTVDTPSKGPARASSNESYSPPSRGSDQSPSLGGDDSGSLPAAYTPDSRTSVAIPQTSCPKTLSTLAQEAKHPLPRHDNKQSVANTFGRTTNHSPPAQGTVTMLGKRRGREEALSRCIPGEDTTVEETDAAEHPEKRRRVDQHITDAASPASPTASADVPAAASPPSSPPFISMDMRPFCTQKCLMGLADTVKYERLPADPACPNYAEHARLASQPTRMDLFRDLQTQIIAKTGFRWMDVSTGSGYSRPVKLRLVSSGHVVVAKAFQHPELRKMYHEVRMYHHLRHLQGKHIPVCLGAAQLPYKHPLILYDDGAVKFSGLMLLGWAGDGMDQWPCRGPGRGLDAAFEHALRAEVLKTLAEIHKAGVLHRDAALHNVLLRDFAREGEAWRVQVMLIDFERSRTKSMYTLAIQQRRRQKDLQDKKGSKSGDLEFTKACIRESDKWKVGI